MRTGHVAWCLVCHIGDILGLPPNPIYVDWLGMAADHTPISAKTWVVVARSAKCLPCKMSLCCLPSCPCTLASHPDCTRMSVFFFCQPYFPLHHLRSSVVVFYCPDLVSLQLWFLRCLCVVACFLPGRLLGLLTNCNFLYCML